MLLMILSFILFLFVITMLIGVVASYPAFMVSLIVVGIGYVLLNRYTRMKEMEMYKEEQKTRSRTVSKKDYDFTMNNRVVNMEKSPSGSSLRVPFLGINYHRTRS